MCGRYGLKLSLDQVVAATEALDVPVDTVTAPLQAWHADGDIAPTDAAPMVATGPRGATLQTARWGVARPHRPDMKGPALVINARCETATERPLFRSARPALVPATGWYEWPAEAAPVPKGARRQPMWLSRANPSNEDTLVWFAALVFGAPTNDTLEHFVIATRPPVDAIATVHDRMPAIVPPDLARAWLQLELSPTDLMTLPHPDLHARLVAPLPVRSRAGSRTPAQQLDLFGPPERS
jgi:putative SOS response-associated peptidase YedK